MIKLYCDLSDLIMIYQTLFVSDTYSCPSWFIGQAYVSGNLMHGAATNGHG